MKKLSFYLVLASLAFSLSLPQNLVLAQSNTVNVADFSKQQGYYGQYYNFSENSKIIKIKTPKKGPEATGWYSAKFFSFAQVDSNLNFGCKFFPVDTGLLGDPYHFAAHWSANLHVPNTGDYNYSISSDDDSWVVIDGQIAINQSGMRKVEKNKGTFNLSAGAHTIDIYYAERKPKGACMSFVLDSRVTVRPRYSGSIEVGGNASNGSNGASQVNYGNNSASANSVFNGNGSANINSVYNGNGVVVAGVSNTVYTPSSGLYRTSESPDVYTIMNNKRHYISSPGSFSAYAYRWEEIKTTSQPELEKYSRARLIKSPHSSTIYFLFQRQETQWLKVALNSPTVFVSYPANYWGNVITVTEQDVDSYPDIKFVKTAGNSQVYLLEDNVRHAISSDVFKRQGYNPHEIVVVNQVHMDSYLLSNEIK